MSNINLLMLALIANKNHNGVMLEKQNHAYDDRADSFLQVGDVATRIAEVHSGVEVDRITNQRWRQLMALLREVDTLFDDYKITESEIIDELVDFSIFKDRYPGLSPDEMETDRRMALVDRTKLIFALGRDASNTESLDDFISIRISEGHETANLLSDSASSYVLSQEKFNNDFMPVIQSLGVTATLIDSIIDAGDDSRRDKITLPVNAEYYRSLAMESIRHSRLGALALMHGSVLGEFGTMSVNRLKNRIRHGFNTYSSLNIFR